MLYYIKLYGLHIKYIVKAEIQYKANFISGIFANFYTYLLMYMSIWILTNKFKVIAGWDYNELIFLMALNLFSYAIAVSALWGHMYGLEGSINNGNFDRILIRPIHPIVSMIYNGFAWTGIGQIIVSSIFLLNSVLSLNVYWSIPKIIALIFGIIGGILIQAAAQIFFGTLSFWIKKSMSLANVLYYTLKEFINYPITIFGNVIKFILTYILPWAFINYYPALYILGKNDMSSNCCIFTPIIGGILLLLSIWLTNKGMSKYESVGN